MQPYFFPYMGYFKLIDLVDVFILLDDVQYIRRGFVNRNKIFNPVGDYQYIALPIKLKSSKDKIRDIKINYNLDWESSIISKLNHYRNKTIFFNQNLKIIQKLVTRKDVTSLSTYNYETVKDVCSYLGIKSKILLSSSISFNYENIRDSGDWAFEISQQVGASEYLNPIGGKNLFNKTKFKQNNINLKFVEFEENTFSKYSILHDIILYENNTIIQKIKESRYNLIT